MGTLHFCACGRNPAVGMLQCGQSYLCPHVVEVIAQLICVPIFGRAAKYYSNLALFIVVI